MTKSVFYIFVDMPMVHLPTEKKKSHSSHSQKKKINVYFHVDLF